MVSTTSSLVTDSPLTPGDLLKSHQSAALTLATLGNSPLINGSAHHHHQLPTSQANRPHLTAAELNSLIPPLLSSELVSKLNSGNVAASDSRIPNGVPLSISTSSNLDDVSSLRLPGDSRPPNSAPASHLSVIAKYQNAILNGMDANASRSEDHHMSSGSASSSRVSGIVFSGSANHIPISPVTAFSQTPTPNTPNHLPLPVSPAIIQGTSTTFCILVSN